MNKIKIQQTNEVVNTTPTLEDSFLQFENESKLLEEDDDNKNDVQITKDLVLTNTNTNPRIINKKVMTSDLDKELSIEEFEIK